MKDSLKAKFIQNGFLIFSTFALFILSLYNIPNVFQIYVLHDEFGYWYNAANLSSYDWTGIAGISAYYSYGYSFFLVPILFIFNSAQTMYRAAIIMNIFFYIGSYLLSYKCTCLIFQDIKKEILALICFITALYSGYLFMVNITWCEPLLLFIFWLVLLTFLNYINNAHWYYIIALILEGAFLYIIHQRTLGVVIALSISLLYFILHDRIKIQYILLFIVTAICVFSAIVFSKSLILDLFWSSSISFPSENVNDYGGQFDKLLTFFTSWTSFASVIQNIICKFFYLFSASCFLILWGFFHVFSAIFNKENKNDILMPFYLFCLMTIIFMEGISSLFFIESNRSDTIIYGRYGEFAAAPFIIFGLCFLYQNKARLETLIKGIIIYLLLSLTVIGPLSKGSGYMYLSSIVGNIFYNPDTDKVNSAYLIVIPLILGIFTFLLFRYQKRITYVIALIPVACLWIYATVYTLNIDVNQSQQDSASYTRFAEDIDSLGDDVPIYFVYSEEHGAGNNAIERIQFILYDRTIKLIFPEDVASLSGDYVLIKYGFENMDMDMYTIFSQTHGLVSAVPNNSSFYDMALEKQFDTKDFDPTDRSTGLPGNRDRDSLVSDHTEGWLSAANYMSLNAGSYEVKLSFHVEEITDNALGAFDITASHAENQLVWDDLTTADIDEEGYATLTYSFDCENSNFVEFRIYTYSNSLFHLDEITYRRIE